MTPEEHTQALKEIMEHLEREEKIQAMILEVEKYEKEHFPIHLPSIGGAIKFRLDQDATQEADLFAYFGKEKTRKLIYEKLDLTPDDINFLNDVIGIPMAVLKQKK